MGRGVRVAADDGAAGLGGAQFRADHVDDALVYILHIEELDAELGAVLTQRADLRVRDLVGDDEAILHGGGRDVVIDRCNGAVGAKNFAAYDAEAVERLGGRYFVDEVEIYVEDGGFVASSATKVLLPDFFEESAGVVLGVVIGVFR